MALFGSQTVKAGNCKKPLRESFDKVDYVLNLDMVQKGILEDIILQRL